MALIGYHASHEQFKPSELLTYVSMAEQAGFQAVNSSDHFYPWSERQGQSGFSFAWLGAAMNTSSLPFGMVVSPGPRYHPAVLAQAIATLCEMFPERFWVSLGSGEALNEAITGELWPAKQDRNIRLKESVEVIRQLLNGEMVHYKGSFTVENAKLYTLPKIKPLLIGAAVTAETAGWMGGWTDGIVTISKPIEELKKTVDAFRQNGGDGKPMYLKVQLSYARSEEEALMGAYDQWRTNIFQGNVLGQLRTVAEFDALGELVKPEDLPDKIDISSDTEFHIEKIRQYKALGFERIILHNVNRDQKTFIQDFGTKVIPQVI
ncbi:TIGR03885 family FMN-dependent LLM class oxidoreductase [Xanthocytophaga agilis]|uniref:TIGR03885 family FMN-dependent LLM class oxidoreductase n=1 Tax=Xanthocytophaga agilis TaxID=3048010 RepID=A0AAE3R203_9BACT|nr:TIGR03885 family FMN-dependent LLM class oxidoreductase [Xanthocytophaga agilis]MDJ1499433.1 TIGR03885 family FMN-dependent LLM class oxidoreductase [Xanthocytophaga agilis]